MHYIYGLVTTNFETVEDYKNNNPCDEYFYVGRTKNPKLRESSHKSKAKNGSEYPYHQKIREVKDDWSLEIIEEVSDDLISDREEYHIVRLTSEGQPLLNIKRGAHFVETCKSANSVFKKYGINNSTDYSKIKNDLRKNKIIQRERKQIKQSLVHVGLDEKEENRIYMLGDRKITAERWVTKNEIIEWLLPSKEKELNDLMVLISKNIEKI